MTFLKRKQIKPGAPTDFASQDEAASPKLTFGRSGLLRLVRSFLNTAAALSS